MSRQIDVYLLRDPDRELVEALREPDGDGFEDAFGQIFARYRDRVYAIAYRITGSGTDALDVVQDSFSLLFRKIGGFRGESLFSTWLFRIVVNASIDHRRKEKSRDRGHATSLATLQSREPEDPTDGPVVRAETRELGAHVQASIGRLSPKLRAIMVLRYLEGMSYEELACTLELSMGTVKSRLARAHVALERVLRGTLAPYGIVEPVDDASGPDSEPSTPQSKGSA